MKKSELVFDLETLSPQKGVTLGKDMITAIGMYDGKKAWVQAIQPGTGGDLLTEEANLIWSFIQKLSDDRPTRLIGFNILGFDLPHILLKTADLSYHYWNRTGRAVKGELYTTLSGLCFLDLMFEEYRRTKEFHKLVDVYRKYVGEPPKEDATFHVRASPKAVLGQSDELLDHLRSDLKMTWEVYEQMKEKLGI